MGGDFKFGGELALKSIMLDEETLGSDIEGKCFIDAGVISNFNELSNLLLNYRKKRHFKNIKRKY